MAEGAVCEANVPMAFCYVLIKQRISEHATAQCNCTALDICFISTLMQTCC